MKEQRHKKEKRRKYNEDIERAKEKNEGKYTLLNLLSRINIVKSRKREK